MITEKRSHTTIRTIIDDRDFEKVYVRFIREGLGRSSSIHYAKRLSENLEGARIYIRRMTGIDGIGIAEMISGQILRAKYLGYRKISVGVKTFKEAVIAADIAKRLLMKIEIQLFNNKMVLTPLEKIRLDLLGATIVEGEVESAVEKYHIGGLSDEIFYKKEAERLQKMVDDVDMAHLLRKEEQMPLDMSQNEPAENNDGIYSALMQLQDTEGITVDPEKGSLVSQALKYAATNTRDRYLVLDLR